MLLVLPGRWSKIITQMGDRSTLKVETNCGTNILLRMASVMMLWAQPRIHLPFVANAGRINSNCSKNMQSLWRRCILLKGMSTQTLEVTQERLFTCSCTSQQIITQTEYGKLNQDEGWKIKASDLLSHTKPALVAEATDIGSQACIQLSILETPRFSSSMTSLQAVSRVSIQTRSQSSTLANSIQFKDLSQLPVFERFLVSGLWTAPRHEV
jgi:hypothetical protein